MDYAYREEVAAWFHSAPALIMSAPPSFKAHALAALSLFAIRPFTRFAHVPRHRPGT